MFKATLLAVVVTVFPLAAYGSVTTEFVETGVRTIDSVVYHIWEMRATEPSDWTNSRLDVTLSAGQMYNHPSGGVTEPDPALFGTFPNLQWDTYVTIPDGFDGDVILAGDVVMEDRTLGVSWADDVLLQAGTWKIAQLTLSDDATGSLEGRSFGFDQGLPPLFTYRIRHGQLIPEPGGTLLLLPGLWLMAVRKTRGVMSRR